jgi:hypothetical protein
LRPSVIIVWQKGHAVVIVVAPVSSSCLVRFTFTRSLFCSSIHICAPPAPQHRPFSLVPALRLDELEPGDAGEHLARRSYTPL